MKTSGGFRIKIIAALFVGFFVVSLFGINSMAKVWIYHRQAESCLVSAKLEAFALTETESDIASEATSIICGEAKGTFTKLSDFEVSLLPEEAIGAIILAGEPDEPRSAQEIIRILESYLELKPELLRREQADRQRTSRSV